MTWYQKDFFGAQKDFLFGITKILLGVKGVFLMAFAELINRTVEEAMACSLYSNSFMDIIVKQINV
jgi:hypothetical protein